MQLKLYDKHTPINYELNIISLQKLRYKTFILNDVKYLFLFVTSTVVCIYRKLKSPQHKFKHFFCIELR